MNLIFYQDITTMHCRNQEYLVLFPLAKQKQNNFQRNISLKIQKKLQKSKTYTCDDSGQVICHQGWSGIEKLCSIPVCDFGNNEICIHGKCVSPNLCACEIGWEGIQCDSCITLPGCQNGHCQNEPFECICDETEKWTGDHCDERKKFHKFF